MKSIYTVLIFIFSSIFLYSENIDSLLHLSEKYHNINLDSSVSYALRAKESAYEIQKRELEIKAINLLSTAFAYKGEIVKFEEMNNHALYLCEKYNLEDMKLFTLIEQSYRYRELHHTTKTISIIQNVTDELQSLPKERRKKFYPELFEAIGYLLYFELKDSVISLEYLHKAHNYYLRRGDTTNFNNLYLYMGEIFRLNGRADRAVKYYSAAKEAAEKYKDSTLLGKYYRLTSATYLDRDNAATALQLLRKAETIFTNLNNFKQLSDLYGMFAYAYSFVNDYKNSLLYNKKSLELRKKVGNLSLVASSCLNIANSFKHLNMLDSSIYYSTIAYKICINSNHNFYLPKSLKMLSELYDIKKDENQSLHYLKKYIALKDSLDLEKLSLVSILESKFRFNMLEKNMLNTEIMTDLENDKDFYLTLSYIFGLLAFTFAILSGYIFLKKRN